MVEGDVVCDIYSAVTLRRSDKRKDRVEISPEMLIKAQQEAEKMSESSDEALHIVGWYHSHPHITVWPSDIDLQTQAGYQQMDHRFIGLIFSVYNEDKKTKVGLGHVSCFQASHQPPHQRIQVPLTVMPVTTISPNNCQALEGLVKTLYEEQMEALEMSQQGTEQFPLLRIHNASVLVRSVCNISNLVSAPLVAMAEEQLKQTQRTKRALEQEKRYLQNLLQEQGSEVMV
ncbi:lys-63-specific deubiquitinase BRCC36-like isoform X2 [Oratosquilla oratoria]|uniref:lys-63-specific deubiquitinase BRCC36-like isoform X2 n=1 Tax=Oratosquilla oratoria TaxID=337810 RepID=UPI003F7755F5